MAGPPVGFGGKLMRTVCFFAVASAGFAGSGEGGVGGTGGGSAIKFVYPNYEPICPAVNDRLFATCLHKQTSISDSA
jgi:hypothetical protein